VAVTGAEGAPRAASVVRKSVVVVARRRRRDWRRDEGGMAWA